MRMVRGFLVVLALLVVLPSAAFAQASITGVVKDTSGAILPGVTVDAASPVLIEKVRSAVTDERGEYRIPSVAPGTYRIQAELPGFATAVVPENGQRNPANRRDEGKP